METERCGQGNFSHLALWGNQLLSPFLTTFTFSHFYFLLCNIFTETIFCVPFSKFSLSHISTYFSLHNKFIETMFTPFPLQFCILLCNIFIETMSVSLLKTFTFSHFYFFLHKKNSNHLWRPFSQLSLAHIFTFLFMETILSLTHNIQFLRLSFFFARHDHGNQLLSPFLKTFTFSRFFIFLEPPIHRNHVLSPILTTFTFYFPLHFTLRNQLLSPFCTTSHFSECFY